MAVTTLLGSALGITHALARPLTLHPQNPHYFLFRGKPVVLITSGEHYGAVLNLDFDYVKYLDTLKADKLNLTRTFSGAYVEPDNAFGIARNTLAPAPGRFICPWARSTVPGYANGGNKFDLNRWDDQYFKRLKDFVRQASRRGVVVELNLFCPFYDESQWRVSPQNAINNINGLGRIGRTNVYTLDKNGGLLAVHDALVRKVVTELTKFDNVYYEICNEPYFGGVTLGWQHHIAEVIAGTEQGFSRKHLISQNIANDKARVTDPDRLVSIFNFHYATPPDTVPMNYALNRVIGDNETGFKGTNNRPYRVEGWEFVMAGGGLFNNLDYSFAAGAEDGTFVYPARQPGGGNPVLRRQYRALTEFIHSLDFIHMKPNDDLIRGGLGEGAVARALVDPGKAYALYIKNGTKADLKLEMTAGVYQVEWLNPRTGAVEKKETLEHRGGTAILKSPAYLEDIALRAIKIKDVKHSLNNRR
jgi:hypothetical protein